MRTDLVTPAEDATPSCSDVMTLRVCWDGSGAPLTAAPAPLPPVPASALGFRCTGHGRERRCRDRGADAPAFECSEGRCVQRHPRLPDDGEWECQDSAGALVCRGGERPSGVAPGGHPEGFFCGAHVRSGKDTGERICVDLSPDRPAESDKYTCHFEGATRVCQKAPFPHALGDVCDRAHPCVDGARCATGLCVPIAPRPSCWVDPDCDQQVCRFGTCTGDAP